MSSDMDPSVDRARAASRAHLILAFACAPFVAAGIGALAHFAKFEPSTLGAVGLAFGVLVGPLAATALRLSAMRAQEPAVAPPAPGREPALTPRERWAREFPVWRESPFRR
jgi:hypothetical protein